MSTEPEAEAYPIVRWSWIPDANPKVPPATGAKTAERTTDSISQQAVQPAKAPNTGIYTSCGKLDDQSRLAQTLREDREKRMKKARSGVP